MPTYVYIGPDERVFPHLSLIAVPGQTTIEADANPDTRFFVSSTPDLTFTPDVPLDAERGDSTGLSEDESTTA